MRNLPRPFVLLEGPGGATHLAWGARSRRTLSWDDPADPSVLTPNGDTPLYGIIAYEFGLPPGVPRRQPAVPQPLVDLFEPENLLVLDDKGRVVRGQGPGVGEFHWEALFAPESAVRETSPGSSWRSFSQNEFEAAVLRAKCHIAAGDIYQVNLSVAERWPLPPDPWPL